MWYSYLIKSGQMERRSKICKMRKLQLLQPHRREKCFAKPEEVIQSSQYALATFAARDQVSRMVTMVDQSLEPVDETM